MITPNEEAIDDFLLSCRYGELEEVQTFVQKYGAEAVVSARDERGNTALHMCCGNGHVEILQFLLPHIPPALLRRTNTSGSPPLHWAILNNHTSTVKLLSELSEEKGGGLALLNQVNRNGRDAFAEALFAGEGKEEVAGYIEGFLFKAEGGEDMVPETAEGAESADGGDAEQDGDAKMEVSDDMGKVEIVREGDQGAEAEAVKDLEEKAAAVRIEGS